ncbi:MAG: hypothetical protein JW757_02810 [Anaerolineales bacterium]|nr:hypothetical protein [Anaerolineales bacterium]
MNTFETKADKNLESWDYKAARLVSNVLNPPLLSALGILVMAWFIGTKEAWRWAVLFVMLVVLVPTGYVLLLLKQGKIENFHIPNRENRTKPYLVIIGTNLLGVILMAVMGAPFLLAAFAVMGVIQSTLMFVINRYWKISGHATAISGLSVFMVAALGWSLAPMLVMVPLVAWARIRTHSHTVWQTIAGVLTGTTFILTTWLVLNAVWRP